MTIRTASIFALCTLAMSAAHAQVEITETQRYIDANTFILNEPCLEFNGTKYKGQFLLDQSAGLTWKLLYGEELTEERNGCISVEAGDQPNEVRYNIGNLVVADGSIDTGQRYDALSTADATRLDLGFAISNAVTSPPSLVVPTSTQTPLYFTNEKYGEGLDVCLSAVGADSITISNANNSVDLTLSSESTTGIKKFCGNIAQDKLENGRITYNAIINEAEEILNAVSYFKLECFEAEDARLVQCDENETMLFEVGKSYYRTIITSNHSIISGVFMEFINADTSEVIASDIKLERITAEGYTDYYENKYETPAGNLIINIYAKNADGLRSVVIATTLVNNG